MTYEIAKQIRDQIEAEVTATKAALAKYPKGPMNLTTDAIKATPEWQAEKRAVDAAFHKLRAFNSRFVKQFKKEIDTDRRARYQ
jgi:hypothetical protein